MANFEKTILPTKIDLLDGLPSSQPGNAYIDERKNSLSVVGGWVVVFFAVACLGFILFTLPKTLVDQYTYNQPECAQERLEAAKHDGSGRYCMIQRGTITGNVIGQHDIVTFTVAGLHGLPEHIDALHVDDPNPYMNKIAFFQVFRDFRGNQHVTMLHVQGSHETFSTAFLPGPLVSHAVIISLLALGLAMLVLILYLVFIKQDPIPELK